MYDFRWDDPISWIAIGIPVAVFAGIAIGIWEGAKWLLSVLL